MKQFKERSFMKFKIRNLKSSLITMVCVFVLVCQLLERDSGRLMD